MSQKELLAVWSKLPERTQKAMLKLMELLSQRYTGSIQLDCHEGNFRHGRMGQDLKL